LSENY